MYFELCVPSSPPLVPNLYEPGPGQDACIFQLVCPDRAQVVALLWSITLYSSTDLYMCRIRGDSGKRSIYIYIFFFRSDGALFVERAREAGVSSKCLKQGVVTEVAVAKGKAASVAVHRGWGENTIAIPALAYTASLRQNRIDGKSLEGTCDKYKFQRTCHWPNLSGALRRNRQTCRPFSPRQVEKKLWSTGDCGRTKLSRTNILFSYLVFI